MADMTTYDETVFDRGEPRRRKGERPAPRPLDALDSQVSLIDVLHGPSGSALIHAMGDASNRTAASVLHRAEEREARRLGDQLNTATTVVVTDRMLDFVLDRVESIPFGDPLVPDDLLFESAYIVLSRPVAIPEITDDDRAVFPPRSDVAYFDAGFYVPQEVKRVGAAINGDDLISDGIMYVQCASVELLEAFNAAWRAAEEAGERTRLSHAAGFPEGVDPGTYEQMEHSVEGIRELKVKHAPVYASGMGFGLSWDPEYREEDFVLTGPGEFERRFWLSLLRTLKEEVFAPVRFKRAEQRRLARRGLIPDVVVADLRRVKHGNKEERLPTGETIMWTHRWRRRGHPRVLYRGTEKERTVWVRECICGPKSMPLIEKDRVYRLSK